MEWMTLFSAVAGPKGYINLPDFVEFCIRLSTKARAGWGGFGEAVIWSLLWCACFVSAPGGCGVRMCIVVGETLKRLESKRIEAVPTLCLGVR